MQPEGVRLAQRILVLLLALPGVPGATGQQTPMEVAAAQLAGPIAHSKQKTLVIFDFSGPGNKVTMLGEKLADDLSAAIARSGGEIRVEDRSKIEAKRKENSYAPEIVLDPQSTLVFANDLGAKAFVVGEMSLGEDKRLTVELKAYRADNGEGIKGLKVLFPLTEEMSGLIAKNASRFDVPADSSKYPPGGEKGYSAPTCISCPRAAYSPEAERNRVQGTVELTVIVREDGTVTDIAVRKGLPGGLTAEAIDAVRKWRLKPATGPDGKPAAVREIIEVTFAFH
jgi:TonB family protein